MRNKQILTLKYFVPYARMQLITALLIYHNFTSKLDTYLHSLKTIDEVIKCIISYRYHQSSKSFQLKTLLKTKPKQCSKRETNTSTQSFNLFKRFQPNVQSRTHRKVSPIAAQGKIWIKFTANHFKVLMLPNSIYLRVSNHHLVTAII